jgi:leader peptidase (prepilin peptidase)/N-methyltransferase
MSIFTYLSQDTTAFLIIIGVLGLIVGSFLNVVIYRVPVMMERGWRGECAEFLQRPELAQDNSAPQEPVFNLVFPASRCSHCLHPIGALENIPVLSFLFQKGRCKHCSTSISWRYPAIELLTAILSVVVAWQLGFGWHTLFALLLTWVLIALSWIDIDRQWLPDSMTLPFLWLGLLLNVFGLYTDLSSAVIGAAAGYLSLWLVFHAFKLATGKEGMGFGDFKLFALFGAWFGWQSLPLIILLSSLAGAVIGLSLILLRGHDKNVPIPFGPYLAIAGWIALLWREPMLQYYMAIGSGG